MKYYAAHNTHADLLNGNRGFLNSWEISRFDSAAERAAFVEKYENKNARALTRSEAESLWKSQYTSVGVIGRKMALISRKQTPFVFYSGLGLTFLIHRSCDSKTK